MRAKAWKLALAVLIAASALAGCERESKTPVSAGEGPNPQLPPPNKTLIPTVNIAVAKGWPPGAKPKPAPGLHVTALAEQLDHPRWLYVLPNGDILVAEANAPPQPEDGAGIMRWIRNRVMSRAGALTTSANRITLLRGIGPGGKAQVRAVFLEGLHSPFGMALVEDSFYVANSDAIVKFSYKEGQTRISDPGVKLVDLPAGPINHHWTKNIIASRDGSKLYASVGSNSNVAENGIGPEKDRAAIWEIDPLTGDHRVYASGLRNPVGMAIEPATGMLWTAVNERDELGSDLVPDYMTSVRDGGFYGWPYSYFGKHVDARVQPQRPDLVASALVPDYALGNHTASLGLTFAAGSKLPSPFTEGAFIGQHGSWNRKPKSGYKVVFVPFQNGKPLGNPVDVLTGFLGPSEEAFGRPVGVAIAKDGALLVADDVGNAVWRVTAADTARRAAQ
jgi:glucose/arabinose dehydrogenase